MTSPTSTGPDRDGLLATLAASRAAQGLPVHLEDEATAARIAALIAATPPQSEPAGEEVAA